MSLSRLRFPSAYSPASPCSIKAPLIEPFVAAASDRLAYLQVYTALISACSREILEAPASNRRLQLVLLERAQGVLAEMRNARLQTDPFLWNALIAAAGRAGQLQRAFQNLDDMQVCCACLEEVNPA